MLAVEPALAPDARALVDAADEAAELLPAIEIAGEPVSGSGFLVWNTQVGGLRSIVKGNRIITRALGNDILHGITRAAVLRFAAEAQFEVEERAFTLEEAYAAKEAFITSAGPAAKPMRQPAIE